MSNTGILLLLAAVSTAAFHALFPDHWLPFVLVARARRWSLKRTLWVTGLSNLLHIAVTVILGMVALVVGLEFSQAVGEAMERATGIMLIVFGLGYAFWSWRRGSKHGHRPEKYPEDKISAYSLAVVLGVDPCVPVLPIFFASSTLGAPSTALIIMVSFALGTLGGALGITALALSGLYKVEMLFLERHGDLLSGLIIAAVGIAALLGLLS